ncbi:MAG TPA: MFS transporter [Burkholderiales bacterium]|nr:MFS transporter [Burkholderiales bacterium]
MTTNAHSDNRSFWFIVLLAAALLMVTMGSRQSQGLFLSPLNTSTGIGIASISLAMAIGQFVWGAVQPIAGAIADRYGPGRVLAAGIVLLALGSALTPFMTSTVGLVFSLGILIATGSGFGSFSVLIGSAARNIPAQKRGVAAGVINAGGSFGQFAFAPITQGLINALGWMGAMWSIAVITLASLPITRALRARPVPAPAATGAASNPADKGIRAALRDALKDRSYILLHAGFFTCGFHIAFLVTHLPGEVQLCGQSAQVASWAIAIIGLSNILGSLVAGWGTQRFRSKYILFWMYASRTALILVYLAAPKTALTFYLFAVGLGLTWLATVPPTATIVGKLFGTRYLATLFGLTLLSHQIGAFLGAYLGGVIVVNQHSYDIMWYLDAGLAAIAALVNLPIREAPIAPKLQPA